MRPSSTDLYLNQFLIVVLSSSRNEIVPFTCQNQLPLGMDGGAGVVGFPNREPVGAAGLSSRPCSHIDTRNP